MKLSNNFSSKELLPPGVIRNKKVNPLWFIRPKIVIGAQFIRDYFGKPMTINNWHIGGTLKYRGFRLPNCPVGAPLSQHRFFNAIDFHITGLDPQEIREEIMKNQELFRPHFSTVEKDTETWVHLDDRNTGSEEFYEVNYY